MKKNKISVILNCYNGQQYLAEALKSVEKQTYKNWKLIFWDNQSKDKSKKILKSFKNKKFKYYKSKKHTTLYAARNLAIQKAKGKFIGFIDADDIWDSKKIEQQIDFMQENQLYCSHTSYNIINENGTVIGERIAKTFKNYKELLKSCDIGLSTVIIERRIFSENCQFPNIKTKEDFVLWLKILKEKNIFGSLDKKLTYWRRSKNSLSSSIIQKLIDGFKVYYIYMNYNFFKSLYFLLCLSFNYLKK